MTAPIPSQGPFPWPGAHVSHTTESDSTDASLERKQRLHSEAVLELAGRAVSVEEPCSRGDTSSFEMVAKAFMAR